MSKNTSTGKSFFWLMGGILMGAAATFILDPALGRRRRALIRVKFFSKNLELKRGARKIVLDLKNRAKGAITEFESSLENEEIDDETLNERVRSEFGRKIRHSKAIKTEVHNNVVTLSGFVLSDEVVRLIKCVKKIRGVKEVINHLDVRKNADGIPDLQGPGPEYLQ